ncbi:hypothetical protein ACJMK2_028941 [Sinanodonta woodiana]|uniref:Protein kinase domain-containing protein n=1 Tax=Sinanodonta woodiana TaxID=1069815 RepID=A0ABD3XAG5_SINWO
MGDSELVISLDENSGTVDAPDNTTIQSNLRHLQTCIFYPKMSTQFNMSTNRDMIGERPGCLVGSSAESISQDMSEVRYVTNHASPKLDMEETCTSINDEELFGEGDKMKTDPLNRKDFGNENKNNISNGQIQQDEDNLQLKRISSQQRDPKYPGQDSSSQRRRQFRSSKDLEVEQSIDIPDIIKSSSESSQSSLPASMTFMHQSPDVLHASEGDVFSKYSDELDGYSPRGETLKEKLEKKKYIEGMSHYPEGKSKPSVDPSTVQYSPSMSGPHPESPAEEKRGRFRSSGYGTDSKQSQNSQNSMEGSTFDGSFEKNDQGSTLLNRRNSKGLGRPQIDSAFLEESGQEDELSSNNKYVSVPNLSIFNFSEVSHDSPPNDSESKCGNLPYIDTLLEMENCDDEGVAVTDSVIQHAIDEPVAVTDSVIQHAIDEPVAVTDSVIQHAIDEPVAVTDSVIQHAIDEPVAVTNSVIHVNDESVAVTNSVIQHVNEGDPKDHELIQVQKNYCLPSPEEISSNSFKPTLDANKVFETRMEKSKESQTSSVESSFEFPPSYKLENFQDFVAQMRHDYFVNQDEINSAKYDQYLHDLSTPSPVGDHLGSPYEKSPRSTPVPLADPTPKITRADLEYSSRCRDTSCMDESCRRTLEVMVYRDHVTMPTEFLRDLCKALQDHCGTCTEPKCLVMFCSKFAQWCHQSFEFEVLMNDLNCLIKEPLLFVNLRKEETKGLQIDGKLPILQEGLVIPLATVSGEFGSPLLARVMSPGCPQLLVIKEISQILDCDQNVTVYKQLVNLTHPHIVSHYWIKEYIDNSMHIFMEFVQGGSLSQYLNTVGRLSWETAVYYSRQLVEAVSFLHQHNIIYLYWDAGNILFTDCSYCQVKLCNLSLSCPADQEQNNFDCSGTKLSLPPHLCPPELGITSQVDTKSDTWGAGCLMIEMLTQKPVWNDRRHENKTDLLELVCLEAPSVPSHLKEEHKKFLQSCLQINIEDRWSFEQVKVFLEQQPWLGKHLKGF